MREPVARAATARERRIPAIHPFVDAVVAPRTGAAGWRRLVFGEQAGQTPPLLAMPATNVLPCRTHCST